MVSWREWKAVRRAFFHAVSRSRSRWRHLACSSPSGQVLIEDVVGLVVFECHLREVFDCLITEIYQVGISTLYFEGFRIAR